MQGGGKVSNQLRKHKRKARREANKSLGMKVYVFRPIWEEMLKVIADHNSKEDNVQLDTNAFIHNVLANAIGSYWAEKKAGDEQGRLVKPVMPGSVLQQIDEEEAQRRLKAREAHGETH